MAMDKLFEIIFASFSESFSTKELQVLFTLSVAMQFLLTECSYPFLSDNYVHRLVQNKTDGKLVQYRPENMV